MGGDSSTQTDVLVTASHARIVALSSEISVLFRTANRDYAETIVEIGRRLGKVRRSLGHGEWLDWVERTAPFGRSAADNYITLADWVDRHPKDFLNWKKLGASKLYAIASLDPAGLRTLRRTKRHAIPGTNRRASLEEMSIPELFRLVALLRDDRLGARAIGRVMSGYRKRVRGLVQATAEVRARRREIDKDDIRELRKALVAAADQLTRTFRLGR